MPNLLQGGLTLSHAATWCCTWKKMEGQSAGQVLHTPFSTFKYDDLGLARLYDALPVLDLVPLAWCIGYFVG
jgi:hypothetical protein